MTENKEKTPQQWANEFGEWLDNEMKQRSVSNIDLARRTGLTRQMIAKYRAKQYRPRPRGARLIAEAFHLNVLEVMALAGYVGDIGLVDPTRARIAALLSFVPDERLREAERFLVFLSQDQPL